MKKYVTKILVVDCGSQYTKLIIRRLEEQGFLCEYREKNKIKEQSTNVIPAGIIISGGPNSPNNQTFDYLIDFIKKHNCPILGICLGLQILIKQTKLNLIVLHSISITFSFYFILLINTNTY